MCDWNNKCDENRSPLGFNIIFSIPIVFLLKLTVMDDGAKVTGIRQIVRLKGFLQKWQKVTLGNRPQSTQENGGISAGMRGFDSDDENGALADVPQGFLAVYVGQELRRFVIPTSYLSDPVFKVLLQKVEEEFGFNHGGGLTIPCEIETFKFLLKCMETHRKGQGDYI